MISRSGVLRPEYVSADETARYRFLILRLVAEIRTTVHWFYDDYSDNTDEDEWCIGDIFYKKTSYFEAIDENENIKYLDFDSAFPQPPAYWHNHRDPQQF